MFKPLLIALTLSAALAAGPSFAHAKLQSSFPADNAQLEVAPKTLTLKFSEAAQLAVLKLISNGRDIPLAVDKAAKPNETFDIALPTLAPGKYTVQWSALAADDGHITKGSFTFSIAG
jgi:copper resistance protein C